MGTLFFFLKVALLVQSNRVEEKLVEEERCKEAELEFMVRVSLV